MNKEAYNMIENPVPMQKITAGDHFSDQVLARMAAETEQTSGFAAYIRTHSSMALLVLLVVINTFSIIIGIQGIKSDAVSSQSTEQEVAEVYFIDPSSSQIYTYLK